jgi:hypothetical protein
MTETLQPPTDNLYKFVAIGALALAIVAFVFLLRENSRQRDRYIDAEIELAAGGYVDGTGLPAEPSLRRAYASREIARSELDQVVKTASGFTGKVILVSSLISIIWFVLWWFRVQRYDDAILRLTAAKLEREEQAAIAQKVPSES